jgi:hypothetical protein
MGKYQAKLLAWYTPHVCQELFEALRQGIADGNVQALRLATEIHGYTKGSGTTVVNNVSQNNDNHSVTTSGAGFDTMIRQLAEQKRDRVGRVTFDAPLAIDQPDK